MKRPLITPELIAVSATGLGAEYSGFEWPEPNRCVMLDVAMHAAIEAARKDAARAEAYATEAGKANGLASILGGTHGIVRPFPRAAGPAEGVTMSAIPGPDGDLFGTLHYASGASLTGNLSAGLGRFAPDEFSPLKRFQGLVLGTNETYPMPMHGLFQFRNGDVFSGTFNSGDDASGLYMSADGALSFVGEIDFIGGSILPIRGIVENRDGDILSAVSFD